MDGRATISNDEKKITETLDKIHKTCMEKKLILLESIREIQLSKNSLTGSEKLKLQGLVEAFYQHIATTSLKGIDNLVSVQEQKKKSINQALQQKYIDLDHESKRVLAKTKVEFIKSLQKSASDYREFIVTKNFKLWPKKFKQFSEEFDAVCTINQDLSPYELDFERAMPHDLLDDESKKNKITPKSIDFSQYTFKALVDIANHIIEKCVCYDDTKALDIIEENLEKKPFSFMKIVTGGIILSHLKKIILIENDGEFILRVRQKSEMCIIEDKKNFEDGLRQECYISLEKAKNIENIAVTHLSHLKNVIDELFHFSYLYQSAFQKHAISFKKLDNLNSMFAQNFHDVKPMNEEKKSTLPDQAQKLLKEVNVEFEEWVVISAEMENLKKRILHYLSLFDGEFPKSLLADLRGIFIKEFQKAENLHSEKSGLDKQYHLMTVLYSVLPLCFTFFSNGIKLLEVARFLHVIEDRIYQSLGFVDRELDSSLLNHEGLIHSAEEDLELMQERYIFVQELKLIIEKNYSEIKQQLLQKKSEMYEPLQEFMTLLNHELAFAASFFAAKDGLTRRIEMYQNLLTQEKSVVKKREDEKVYIKQLKIFVNESLLKNLHLWRPACFSGSDLFLHNKQYSIADGIAEIFNANRKFEDPYQWLFQFSKIVHDRCKMMSDLKYSFFNIRSQERNAFYQALRVHLDAKESNIESLKNTCKKISTFRA